MRFARLVCSLRGHRWRRFRSEGATMRECRRCGHLVRADEDPPIMMAPG